MENLVAVEFSRGGVITTYGRATAPISSNYSSTRQRLTRPASDAATAARQEFPFIEKRSSCSLADGCHTILVRAPDYKSRRAHLENSTCPHRFCAGASTFRGGRVYLYSRARVGRSRYCYCHCVAAIGRSYRRSVFRGRPVPHQKVEAPRAKK